MSVAFGEDYGRIEPAGEFVFGVPFVTVHTEKRAPNMIGHSEREHRFPNADGSLDQKVPVQADTRKRSREFLGTTDYPILFLYLFNFRRQDLLFSLIVGVERLIKAPVDISPMGGFSGVGWDRNR
jgi:hypothetical protein